MEDLPQRFSVNLMRLHGNRCLNRHETEFTQVTEENSDHAERKIDVGSDIYHCRCTCASCSTEKCSGPSPPGSEILIWVAVTVATRSKASPECRVRPRVRAYGRTTGPASASSHRSSFDGMSACS